jgi:hypothetical protein
MKKNINSLENSAPSENGAMIVKIRYRKRPVAVYLHSVRRRNGLLNITLKTIYK